MIEVESDKMSQNSNLPKELLNINYPLVPYFSMHDNKYKKLYEHKNQYKYKKSYNYDLHCFVSEDETIKIEQHDKFIQILLITRFIEKHTNSPSKLVSLIFPYITEKNKEITITIITKIIPRRGDWSSSCYGYPLLS